jgi:hypothetical protein
MKRPVTMFFCGVLIAVILAWLAGCAQQVPVPVKPTPPDVHVPPECETACTCDVPAPTITTDPYSGVDAALYEHKAGRTCTAQCDVRRKGCVDAINRARNVGAIK